jgi:hypothetical protein
MFQIASLMFDGDEMQNDMPAGYTYLGQFIIHDISFDPTSINERNVDPEFLWNFRTPAIDLDSVYGSGPALAPYFYDQSEDRNYGMTHFVLPRKKPIKKGDPSFTDLPRVTTDFHTALIADSRNDENIIISQIHAAFLQLHNKVVDGLSKSDKHYIGASPQSLFLAAQKEVRWYFQWIVLYDYLPRVLDLSEWKSIKYLVPTNSTNTNEINALVRSQIEEIVGRETMRELYDWRNEPFIPLEFSVAAFRFGHSQVRAKYLFNRDESGRLRDSNGFEIKVLFPTEYFESKKPFARVHMPFFFPQSENDRFVKNKIIEPVLSNNMKEIPTNMAAFGKRQTEFVGALKDVASRFSNATKANHSNLAERNLIRGLMLRLPSGQSVAKAMGLDALTIEGKEGFPQHLINNTPLWYYILYEAEKEKQGKRLGPVGSRIVVEVIIGLIQGDKTSFLNQDPNWVPKDVNGDEKKDFIMADLLELAGVYNP